jgi:hypothetical protein
MSTVNKRKKSKEHTPTFAFSLRNSKESKEQLVAIQEYYGYNLTTALKHCIKVGYKVLQENPDEFLRLIRPN